MKKNTFLNLVALSALISTGSLIGQNDTVRVRTTTTETYSTNTNPQTTTPSTVATPAPAPAAAAPATQVADDDNKRENPPLRRVELGVRWMPTFSTLRVRTYNNETVQGEISLSQGWGVMGGFNFSEHIGLVAELDYIEINQKYKDRNLNRQVNVSYLNIPVMLSLNTDKEAPVNVNFVVGPQFGLNIGGSTSGDQDSVYTAKVGVKGGDIGAAYGAGLEFALNHDHTFRLDVGFRGYVGLVDMNDRANKDTYTVSITAARRTYAGYLGIAFLF